VIDRLAFACERAWDGDATSDRARKSCSTTVSNFDRDGLGNFPQKARGRVFRATQGRRHFADRNGCGETRLEQSMLPGAFIPFATAPKTKLAAPRLYLLRLEQTDSLPSGAS
jgi:hypothetical protein